MQITNINVDGEIAEVTFEAPELLTDGQTVIITVAAAPATNIGELKIMAIAQLIERLNSALGQAGDLRTAIIHNR